MFEKIKTWWGSRKPNNKVFVRTGLINVWKNTYDEFVCTPEPELKEWLDPYHGQYKFGYDQMTGKRWIEFNDNSIAVMCRLVFA